MLIITREDIDQARSDQGRIHQATQTEYSVKQILQSLDCQISEKGIAERILIELQGEIKFDRASNQFLIKSEGQYKKANPQLIRDIVSATIQKLPKEIRVINDAVKAGILTDAESQKVRLIRYVERSCPHNVHTVVSIMKTLLTS